MYVCIIIQSYSLTLTAVGCSTNDVIMVNAEDWGVGWAITRGQVWHRGGAGWMGGHGVSVVVAVYSSVRDAAPFLGGVETLVNPGAKSELAVAIAGDAGALWILKLMNRNSAIIDHICSATRNDNAIIMHPMIIILY